MPGEFDDLVTVDCELPEFLDAFDDRTNKTMSRMIFHSSTQAEQLPTIITLKCEHACEFVFLRVEGTHVQRFRDWLRR